MKIDELKEALSIRIKLLNEANAKIAEANKILDEFIKSEPIGTITKKDLKRLQKCLANDSMRKR